MELPDVRQEYIRIENVPNSSNPNEKILIHLSNDPFLAENVSNTIDGCYLNGDIFLEDPPHSWHFQILDRHDDTLVHLNGEKTNPLFLENQIRHCSLIKQVAVIGQNQFCPSALIQLNLEEAGNYNFQQIQDKIWQAIQRANEHAPAHSGILKELVYILPISDILPVTHKGNLLRQKINQDYSQLIKEIYEKFFNQSSEELTTREYRSEWTKENLRNQLINIFKLICSNFNGINSSQSIFTFGIHSLQILELTNLISKEIYQISKNFLYEYSSLEQIIEQLYKIIHSNDREQIDDPFHYELTEQIINKYIHLIQENPIRTEKKMIDLHCPRVFLLTGATGSLGSFLLRDLLEQSLSMVKRVYCLLRGSDLRQRLFQTFKQRKLNETILIESLENQRLILLPFQMNLSEEYLGQSSEIYEELKNELTDIIHSAWKMNFNQTIKDFEEDSILGVYHLLKLSSFNQIQFHFISSISSAGSGSLPLIKEEPLPRITQVALPQGYGQSKYAAEHISWAAYLLWSRTFSFSVFFKENLFVLDVPVNIYRVGQISGDRINGIWNENELVFLKINKKTENLIKVSESFDLIGFDLSSVYEYWLDVCPGYESKRIGRIILIRKKREK
jgi:hypothetical protein